MGNSNRRAFLWQGTRNTTGGHCKVAWRVVCSPQVHGGLGVPDLRITGFALRLRWEWLKRTQGSAAWSLLPSKVEKAVAAMFDGSVFVVVGDGRSASFWCDSWLPAGPIRRFAPALFAAVLRRAHRRSVSDALANRRWVRDIAGALTANVLCDYVTLWEMLEGVSLTSAVPDKFVWRWTADGIYSASSAYRAFFVGMADMLGVKELWRARAPPKVKLFF